jgi:hypothetical protein
MAPGEGDLAMTDREWPLDVKTNSGAHASGYALGANYSGFSITIEAAIQSGSLSENFANSVH